ncbi:MAG: response regulator [Pirellulaceae bacterium]|nr:MAG: response regulator [Pirellulaceae bacterium]
MSTPAVGRPMEVLLVEDNLMDAQVAIRALRDGQVIHRMTLVVDGDEAVEFLKKQGRFRRAPRPDIVLLDLFLPKRSGLAVLAEIRNDPDLQSLPVVVLTTSEDEAIRAECERYEVDCYMVKPVNLEKFIAVVRQVKRQIQQDVILPV